MTPCDNAGVGEDAVSTWPVDMGEVLREEAEQGASCAEMAALEAQREAAAMVEGGARERPMQAMTMAMAGKSGGRGGEDMALR